MLKKHFPKLQWDMKKYFPEGKETKRTRNPAITISQNQTFNFPEENFNSPGFEHGGQAPEHQRTVISEKTLSVILDSTFNLNTLN